GGAVDRQVKGRRGRAGVAGRAGGGDRAAALAIGQRAVRRDGESPVAVGVGGGCAGRHVIDVQRDGAARLGRASKGRRVVVGDVGCAEGRGGRGWRCRGGGGER